MDHKLSSRIVLSVFNLLLVASFGVMMRYKIGFEFPFFDQTNLQHAHSHFAFYGWITHTLMSLIIAFLERNTLMESSRKYDVYIAANLISSYAMLLSFTLWGYNIASIVFSTSAIIISFAFTISFIRDIKKYAVIHTAVKWFQAALVFNTMASLGTLALAFMMATHHLPQHLYLASVYFYLHFQYNGWFFFASIGLLQLFLLTIGYNQRNEKLVFNMLVWSCIPAYLLSVLWINLPLWLYIIVVIASIIQFMAWLLMLKSFWQHYSVIRQKTLKVVHYLLIILSIALTVKFTLQLGSVIPFISKLAFGFRPVVIAYLHLVLLAIISIFLLTYLMSQKIISTGKISIIGILILVGAIYSTEIVLAVQGIASFSYTVVPYTNEILFVLACCMFIGILILFLGQRIFPKHD